MNCGWIWRRENGEIWHQFFCVYASVSRPDIQAINESSPNSERHRTLMTSSVSSVLQVDSWNCQQPLCGCRGVRALMGEYSLHIPRDQSPVPPSDFYLPQKSACIKTLTTDHSWLRLEVVNREQRCSSKSHTFALSGDDKRWVGSLGIKCQITLTVLIIFCRTK